MLLLATYRNGARRKRHANQTREPLWLPEPPWFKDLLASEGLLTQLHALAGEAFRGVSLDGQCCVKALVTVGPGVIWNGPLTEFDRETDLLWNYWYRPSAAYSVVVRSFFSLRPPVKLHMREGVANAEIVTLQHYIFRPAVPVLTEALRFLARGDPNQEVLGFHDLGIGELRQDVPVIFIPETIFALMERGKWRSILMHIQAMRRAASAPKAILASLKTLKVEMQWPSEDQFSMVCSKQQDHQPGPKSTLSWDSIWFLRTQLRKHSDVIITDGGRLVDAGQLAEQQKALESALEGLELLATCLAPKVSHLQHAKVASQKIIDQISAVRYLRNRSELKGLKQAVISSLMPEQLQSLAKTMMGSPLSGSTISRYQAGSLIRVAKTVRALLRPVLLEARVVNVCRFPLNFERACAGQLGRRFRFAVPRCH